MRKAFITILVTGVLFLFGCQNNLKNNGEVIEINLTEALKNHKDFPLSKLVKDVEILELESNIECYIKMPHFWFLGEEYLLVFDNYNRQLFLFDNSGNFIRKIGRPGKGPGEYNGMMLQGTMSTDEKHIVITNASASIVIVYDLLGNVKSQKNLGDFFSAKYIQGIECHFDKLISFLPHRPWEPSEDFSSVVLFDMELNKIVEVLPRANDENLVCNNIQHNQIFTDGKSSYFWEMYNDTVYQFNADGDSSPKYRFVTDKNSLTHDMMYKQEWSRDIYEYTFPWAINFIPGYLVVNMSGAKHTVLYNLKTGESFSIGKKTTCLIDMDESKIWDCIENDVFGFEAPRLYFYVPNQKICVQPFEWDRYSESKDLACIQNLEVTHPKVRDKLVEYCKNPSEDLGVVLVLMHMRLPRLKKTTNSGAY